jgi:hypothetical protein
MLNEMDDTKTEELLIDRLESGRLNSRADLDEVERIAKERGLTRVARRASRQRRKLRTRRRRGLTRLWRRSD